ncbi:unnamed protein product [Tenebrio molitor]|nr:unnamed protein product [Tenebrio molitor]
MVVFPKLGGKLRSTGRDKGVLFVRVGREKVGRFSSAVTFCLVWSFEGEDRTTIFFGVHPREFNSR